MNANREDGVLNVWLDVSYNIGEQGGVGGWLASDTRDDNMFFVGARQSSG